MKFEIGERVLVNCMGTGQDEVGVIVEDMGISKETGQHHLLIDFYPKFHHGWPVDEPGKSEFAISIENVLKINASNKDSR